MEVIVKLKTVYKKWQLLLRHIPKLQRFTFGNKVDALFIEALEYLFRAQYASPEMKIKLLVAAIGKVDLLKFFLQIGWENKLIDGKKYSELTESLQEIGRMLGGWKKGLEAKLSPKR